MMSDERTPPVALTIAGFDPSGGAGIIADIKTFNAFGCFSTAVVTSLTYQNTLGVYGAVHQTGAALRAQLQPVIEDFKLACIKTGMLPTREVIEAVAHTLSENVLPAPVVDPVVRSTSGYDLIDDAALSALISELLPLARVVTPNIPEVERMTGLRVVDLDGMRRAARAVRAMGARAVLVKGGHLVGLEMRDNEPEAESSERHSRAGETVVRENSESHQFALDLLDDEGALTLFREPRINSTSTHGTGCTLAAGIAACLGRGMSLVEAISAAKGFVTDAILHAPPLGRGHGPLNHNRAVRFDRRNFEPLDESSVQ